MGGWEVRYVAMWPPSSAAISVFYTDFDWQTAPLSDIRYPLGTGVCYVCAVLCWSLAQPTAGADQRTADEKKAAVTERDRALKPLVAIHNLILCAGSLIMCVGTGWELRNRAAAESGAVDWFFCEAPSTRATGPLFFWSYMYYLSKYYELIDTGLQLLRGKPPPHFLLHVYHHACVILMAWAWCEYAQSLQFGGLLFNTAVHVVMYLYFFLRVVSGPPWWKRFVTQFQIVQFCTSLACFCRTAWMIAMEERPCAGQRALAANLCFNITLLYKFVGVSKANAKQQRDKAA